MLCVLQLQVDGGLNQTLTSKTVSAPDLNSMDFPALSVRDGQNDLAKFTADGLHQNGSPYRSPEKQGSLLFRSNSFVPSRGATDFASAVRKMAPQDSSMWKYERNGSSDASIGSSRSSQVLASSFNSGQGRGIYGDRFQSRGSARSSPVWLETGDAVGNDHRQCCFYLLFDIFNCGSMHSAIIYALTLVSWQQICTLRCGRKLVIMHVCAMYILSRYVLSAESINLEVQERKRRAKKQS